MTAAAVSVGVVWAIALVFSLMLRRKKLAELLRAARREELVRMARKFAHDAHTPLLALEGVDTSGMDERSRGLYASAISDLRGLILGLRAESGASGQGRGAPEKIEPEPSIIPPKPPGLEHLLALVEEAVSERRGGREAPREFVFEPDPAGYRAFARVHRSDARRIVSDLLDRAAAEVPLGALTVFLSAAGDLAQVGVKDDAGKTIAVAKLPSEPAPEWFAAEVRFGSDRPVVVLDDSDLVAAVWRQRFRSAGLQERQFFALQSGDELKRWCRENDPRGALFLVDYELETKAQSGLGVIEELGISESSVLVTGSCDDPVVQAKARWLGVRMLPKHLLHLTHLEALPG